MKEIIAGATSGFIATLPMTKTMIALHKRLPRWEQYPLPPRQITMNLANAAGIENKLDEKEKTELTYIAHYGYGAAMGALYGLAQSKIPGPSVVKGTAFGLGVWTVSYLGLLPKLGLLSSATQHPPERNALMIGAHIIWGASAGALFSQMTSRFGLGERPRTRREFVQ